jgi:hypothetical protein
MIRLRHATGRTHLYRKIRLGAGIIYQSQAQLCGYYDVACYQLCCQTRRHTRLDATHQIPRSYLEKRTPVTTSWDGTDYI